MYANKSAADLQEDLETERNNLEMNSGANPGVVEQYERRKREVAIYPISGSEDMD